MNDTATDECAAPSNPHQTSYWAYAAMIGFPTMLLTTAIATLITFTSQGYPEFIAYSWAFAIVVPIICALVAAGYLRLDEQETATRHDQHISYYQNTIQKCQEAGFTSEQANLMADTTIGRQPHCCRPRPR